MAASTFCCTQPQQRIDSPEPPSRPIATVDGIFAAAALPEDHPHALKFPDRKPEVDASIVRSPNIANRIRLQFRKRSMKSLSHEDDYDKDARQMSSQEVIHEAEETSEHHGEQAAQLQGSGSAVCSTRPQSPEDFVAKPQVRTSVFQSLGYLKPLLQKPTDFSESGELYNLVEIANRVAARYRPLDAVDGTAASTSVLPKSFSTPILLSEDPSSPPRPRKSRSELDFGDIVVPKQRKAASTDSGDQNKTDNTIRPRLDVGGSATPTLHLQQPSSTSSSYENQHEAATSTLYPITGINGSSTSSLGLKLHKMDISQQLRSMSQLSDVVEDEALLAPYPTWQFHQRERSDFGAVSARSRHSRHVSSSGLDSTALPTSWGQVYSPLRDAASSIYSRPTSAGANSIEAATRTPDLPTHEPMKDLATLFADWPLKPSPSTENHQRASQTKSNTLSDSEKCTKPLPPTPPESRKDSGTASFVTATNDEGTSIKWLSPPQRSASSPSKSSSSTFTKASKQSKFLERFSPPKKTVKKRRSIFKFLRPGSRKQQIRSISSPVLIASSNKSTGGYDGQSDDPALLTVQYELSDLPNQVNRSASMGHLGTDHHHPGASQLETPHKLQRRPTMADYERELTVSGDDRRRPSAVNIQRIKEVQEEDRRESGGLRRKLSRARPLKDDASPLMAQALEKHQHEKALFRSASKQRESLHKDHPVPVFGSSPFTIRTSSLSPEDQSDLLDPLEKGYLVDASRGSATSEYLQLPETTPHGSGKVRGKAPLPKTSSPHLAIPPDTAKKTKIGTSLDSWSRYPSHTRTERCGSAGPADRVITRDFAVNINPDDIHTSDDNEVESPQSKRTGRSSGKRSTSSLPKSRSMTLSGILRYYSNLFHSSSTFKGQNRRSSVTTGGRLEYPELEMLPPQLPADTSSHHHAHSDHLKHLKEHVIDDAERFKDYVQKEERDLGVLVKREEDQFENFMKKEEGKFKHFVQDEEDKLFHHQLHRSSEHGTSRRSSPFRAGSIFAAEGRRSDDNAKRRDTVVGPTDHVGQGAPLQDGEDSGLVVDGAAPTEADEKLQTTSKAQIWSNVYKECLTRPVSTDAQRSSEATVVLSTHDDDSQLMPPPTLKPAKPRSPDQPKTLDRDAKIRRFPSVTVIDDRKGHFRSVSLISVKTSKSTNFERSSTHDLLELIEARERQEREKLLKAIEAGERSQTSGN